MDPHTLTRIACQGSRVSLHLYTAGTSALTGQTVRLVMIAD